MKAYLEVLRFNAADVVTASGGCANPDALTGIDTTLGGGCDGCDND